MDLKQLDVKNLETDFPHLTLGGKRMCGGLRGILQAEATEEGYVA